MFVLSNPKICQISPTKNKDFEISRAQAIQAIGARCKITADLNPILLKPLGNYYSTVFLQGKKIQKKCMQLIITKNL